MSFRVFLSYSWANSAERRALAEEIGRIPGVAVLVDKDFIQPGDPIHKTIMAMMSEADCIVVLLTLEGLKSREVLDEISRANDRGKFIVPIVGDGTSLEALPWYLRDQNFILYSGRNFDAVVESVAGTVKRLADPLSDVERNPIAEAVRRKLDESAQFVDVLARSSVDIVPAAPNTPNNLPRLQPFFGRTEELKQIADALDPESRTWGVLIDGPGGMGKTSLAVRAAYDCRPGQFERIIFLSLKERELNAGGVIELGGFILRGLIEMLNELARELGQPDIAKSTEEERIRFLIKALRPMRVLLILDNLESLPDADRARLVAFVTRLPQGCKAILTSRRRFGLMGDTLILEKLDQNAALKALADLARRLPLLAKTNRAERIAFYTQTGGKPLLLRWVAGQLGLGSCRTLAHALNFLRSCPPDNDPLEFIFGDLAKEFTDDETKVLAALTYFTLPAKLEHITALAGIDENLIEPALRALCNRSLVVPDQEEEHFALVPMVANFLRRKRFEVVAETGSRLEQRAYALIVENGYNNHDRFLVLDAAWPTVAPALPLFIAGPNDRLHEVCTALFSFLHFTGRWDELIALSVEAEAKAVAVEDFREAGWRANGSGYIHYRRRDSAKVLAAADRMNSHWSRVQIGANEQAIVIRMRGHWYRLNKDYTNAIEAYRSAVELWRTLGEETIEFATGVNALAEAERLSGDFAAAKRHYSEALRLAKATNYHEGIAAYTGNLAEVALDSEDWSHAELLADEALKLGKTVGRTELMARDCHCLAQALVRQGKVAGARPYARRAVEIYTLVGSPKLEGARKTLRECES